MIQNRWVVRPCDRRDIAGIRSLSYFNFHVYHHLDWQRLDDYLFQNYERVWVCVEQNRIIAAIGLSDMAQGTCWLRFMVASDDYKPHTALKHIFQYIAQQESQHGLHSIFSLITRDWLHVPMSQWGFSEVEEIVTLERRHSLVADPQPHPDLQLSPISLDRLEDVYEVDQHAFEAPWHMQQREIRMAIRTSHYNRILYIDRHPVGYQFTTLNSSTSHLARLAVHPQWQGYGIGAGLLQDMLYYFQRRKIYASTVNTQQSNERSLRLYTRYAYQPNGYNLPVWMATLKEMI
ncbi:MAG: GNAT family N-acetyltransferase [Phototrophicaceae bacterium]